MIHFGLAKHKHFRLKHFGGNQNEEKPQTINFSSLDYFPMHTYIHTRAHIHSPEFKQYSDF